MIYRLAHAVMRPVYDRPIDLDASSSAYWQEQWPAECRPQFYLDGTTDERNTIHLNCNWISRDPNDATVLPPTVFDNPPGDSSGDTVQEFYRVLATRHADRKIASLFWVGFSLEQLTSLQGVTEIDPLHVDACTLIPSRRTRYRVHPERALESLLSKFAKQRSMEVDRLREELESHRHDPDYYDHPKDRPFVRQVNDLMARIKAGNLSPVTGDAPTHASYFTILWHREARTRRKQQSALRAFLKGQRDVPRSLFERCRVIGRIDT